MQKSLVMMAGWAQFSICGDKEAGAQSKDTPLTSWGATATTQTAAQAFPGPSTVPEPGRRKSAPLGATSRPCLPGLPRAGFYAGDPEVPDTGLTTSGLSCLTVKSVTHCTEHL